MRSSAGCHHSALISGWHGTLAKIGTAAVLQGGLLIVAYEPVSAGGFGGWAMRNN